MSRFAIAAATLSLVLPITSGAHARQSEAQIAAARPADAATRAAYERADALARSVFWSNEHNINPLDPVAGVKMAQALRELGQFDQAATAAEAVLSAQPDNAEAMLELGRAHIARGQAFYGIEALEKARDANRRDWRPLSLLGVAYQQVRRPQEAQAAWNAALALSPDNPDVLTNAAMAWMGSGDLAQAEALLRRAAARPDASLKIHQNLALALGLQGKMSEAEDILRRRLPPEHADQNLAWLNARNSDRPPASAPQDPPSSGRTWNSLQQPVN